jgi:YidC/Oxa1 family membrane protein insertase
VFWKKGVEEAFNVKNYCMDRNTVIGLFLIFALFITWNYLTAPTKEELEARKRAQDSIAALQNIDTTQGSQLASDLVQADTSLLQEAVVEGDSVAQIRKLAEFGPFAAAAAGAEETMSLENEVFKVTFSTKGGFISEVLLKNYNKIEEDERKKEVELPLKLLEDEKDRFEYLLPVKDVAGGVIKTSDLYFQVVEKTDQKLVLRASAGQGRYFEQRFEMVDPEKYVLDYSVKLEGLQGVIDQNAEGVQLHWLNYLDKLEKNTRYERMYSSTYYKEVEDSPTYCSLTGDDTEDTDGSPVKWVAHANQFFTTSLIADNNFQTGVMDVQVLEEGEADLKRLETRVVLPYTHDRSETVDMTFYLGPKEFSRLRAMGDNLEDVIPFGWSIFGTINRWIVRPIFNFLSTFIGNKGVVILFLTLIVKLTLFPLTYKMLYSQSKMAALKPQLESMRAKFKDDQQKQSAEQMKLYREFGVNPLGGCMPLVLQMPIWFALYRFFPAAIEFRQAGFLWATDLSSYDVIARLPFEIPLGFGSHISLFTLLWAATTLIYTYYNSKHMDMSAANPAMRYMQYIMPVMFLGFFNSYASGLTAYLFFSNLINIAQTLITKNYIIDKEKIKRELEAYRKKPKKKGGFQARLESALKEQQRIQAEKEAAKKKKKK